VLEKTTEFAWSLDEGSAGERTTPVSWARCNC